MLELSMVCFPYVVMGVGQVVIAGINVNRKEISNTGASQRRRMTCLTFEIAALKEKDRTRSESPVLLPS